MREYGSLFDHTDAHESPHERYQRTRALRDAMRGDRSTHSDERPDADDVEENWAWAVEL